MVLYCVAAATANESGLRVMGHLASSMGSLAMWQTQDAINSGHAIWLEVFVTVAAISLAVQAAVVVGLAFGALKAQKAIVAEIAIIKGKVMPLVDKSHALMTDLTPEIKAITTKVHDITQKVDVITAHIEEIAGLAKDKAHEFAPTISKANVTFGEATDTARDVNQKTRAQVTRVNGMVTSTLDATAALGRAIERGISLPGREIAGIVSGAKATLDSFLKKNKGFGPGKTAGRPPVYPASRPQSAGSGVPVSAGVPARPAAASAAGASTVRPAEAAIVEATAAFERSEKRGEGLETL